MPMVAIQDIYDAAFDRQRMSELIERLCVDFGAGAGFIAWTDLDRDAGFHAQYGNDPIWLQRYVETYAAVDVMRPHLQAADEGQCVSAWALLQTPAIRESVFYREYLAPQGVVDNLAVNLVKRPDHGLMAHLALLRHAPAAPFSDADRQGLAALVPHLRRAILIQSRLVGAGDRAAASRALARGGATALMLLDGEGRVIEADDALRTLANLRVGERLDDGSLGGAVASALRTGEPQAIELRRDGESRTLLIEGRRLDDRSLADLAADTIAAHAVHVTFVDRPPRIAFDAFATLYRLTPTERRVLEDAIGNGDLTGIGQRQGMATATARTHLHRIYDKTGTGSFARLASLAHRFRRIDIDQSPGDAPKQMMDADRDGRARERPDHQAHRADR